MSLTYKFNLKEKSFLETNLLLLLDRYCIEGKGQVYVWGGAKPNEIVLEPVKGSSIKFVGQHQDQEESLDGMLVASSPKHISFKLYKDVHYLIYYSNRGTSKK